MKRKLSLIIGVLLTVLILQPAAASGSQKLNIPKEYHGMWICEDAEDLPDKLLMEITASDVYFNGAPFSVMWHELGASTIDITERISEASYSIVMEFIVDDSIPMTGYSVIALDSTGNLLLCVTLTSDHEDFQVPKTTMLLFNRL